MSERHHRRSPQRRLAHERFDKTLLRLPAPFYRLPDRTITAGPGAAQVAMIVHPVVPFLDTTLTLGLPRLVLGWRIARANDVAIGYYVKIDNGFPLLERQGAIPDETEGLTWCRTWNDEEKHRALIAAYALR